MNISEVDILKIDESIIQENKIRLESISNLEKEKESVNNLIERNKKGKCIFSENVIQDLEKRLFILEKEIKNIINDSSYNFYVMETYDIIKEYKQIIEKPSKISFFGKTKVDNNKENIIKQYIDISNKYYSLDKIESIKKILNKDYKDKKEKDKINKFTPEKQEKYLQNLDKNDLNNCPDCLKNFEIEDEKYICKDCGCQKDILGNMTSYKDINRVNITYKFTYERIVHFKDCINQYQGKQNSNIDESIYKQLERQFEVHGLLEGNKNTPREERFKNITKEHIIMFLKETGNSNNYEHVFLIFNTFTGKKNDDISHLEKVLLEDFETLSNLYDKKFRNEKKIDRKSFINTQYVLYQLLRKHKHPCKKEDFNILKTLDRKSFHDDILSELFQELSWNYIPCF
jgi:hypothetical protein